MELENASGPLLLNIDGRVALLTLNRGAQRNSLHPELIAALSQRLATLRERDDIDAIVVTANGPAFCSGLDLAHLHALPADERVRYMRSAFALFEQVQAMPQPLIAAINGPAVAGGFDLAVFCDLRVCVPAARFAQPEVMLGATQFFYPAWTLIGAGRARELALTGLPIDAAEAHRIGLVNHLVEPDDLLPKALALAQTIASRPRAAVRAAKRLARELPGLPPDEAFKRIGEALDRSLRSDQMRAALERYLAGSLKS